MVKMRVHTKFFCFVALLVAVSFMAIGCATKGENNVDKSNSSAVNGYIEAGILKIDKLSKNATIDETPCNIMQKGNSNKFNDNSCNPFTQVMMDGDENYVVGNKIYGDIKIIGDNNIIKNSVIKANITIKGDNVKIIDQTIE